jgi:hypothetical protein
MVQIYASLIKMGLRTIEQVPLVIRGDVEDVLARE